MVNNVQEILFQKVEDKAKDNEEIKEIEREQKSATCKSINEKMKEQCIKSLGPELFQKLYDCMKKLKKKGVYNFDQSEEFKKLANDKEKKNRAFFIDQIIEYENTKQ